MLLAQMLLPRFLVLEVLLLLRLAGGGRGCITRAREGIARAVDDALSSCKADNQDSSSISSSSCGIDLHNRTEKNLPLFVSDSQLLFPTLDQLGHRVLRFPTSDVHVYCPGSKIAASGKSSGLIECEEDLLELEGEMQLGQDEVRCTKSIREKVVRHNEPCGPSDGAGKLLDVGWQLGRDFFNQLSICFDQPAAHTHYVQHTVRGSHMAVANAEPGRPAFKEGRGLYPEVSADAAYKVSAQERTLGQLLGRSKTASVFAKSTSFLARGHLAPDADFIWKEWQDATYYFANAAPQWQPFNNGNWKAVEAEVRHYAEVTGHDIEVTTGTLGHLKYDSDSGQATKLYVGISGTKKQTRPATLMPVPEFYWKVVHDPAEGGAVVFVGLNDPNFQGDASIEAQICPDVCDESMWFFAHRKDVARGFTYCCSFQEFKQAVEWAPELSTEDPELLKNRLI